MRKLGRYLYEGIVLGVVLVLLMMNVRLYHRGASAYARPRLGRDVLPQLNFIGQELRNGAGEEMQELFPEGYYFTHALYGLTWVEVGLRAGTGSELYDQALAEVRWSLERLESEAGRSAFAHNLTPSYGVFYQGWTLWLEGGLILLQPKGMRDPAEMSRYETRATMLAEAFAQSDTPFLQAYPGASWPVDNVVAIAALRLHDTQTTPRFARVIARWREQCASRSDPATGLLPHFSDNRTGAPLEIARATSQSLIARFAAEIDPVWGREVYTAYREKFVRIMGGVPGALEYPHGHQGPGDVDSGPLVFGYTASATVVTIGTAQVHGDAEVADTLIAVGEALGQPISWGVTKRYALGRIPVGDAFLAWSKSSSRWTGPTPAGEFPDIVPGIWRWPYHFFTLCVLAVFAWPRMRRWRRGARVREASVSQVG